MCVKQWTINCKSNTGWVKIYKYRKQGSYRNMTVIFQTFQSILFIFIFKETPQNWF